MRLHLEDVVLSSTYSLTRAFVAGGAFGPALLLVGGTFEEAHEEYHVRMGEHVDPTDGALEGYEGPDRTLAAMGEGDITWTHDGHKWTDHYVWIREFQGRDAVRRAGQYYREGFKN